MKRGGEQLISELVELIENISRESRNTTERMQRVLCSATHDSHV